MIARLEANMASASDAHTSWTVAKKGENGHIFMAKTIDFDALGGLIMNEDQLQWDKKMALNTLRTLCSQWMVILIIIS